MSATKGDRMVSLHLESDIFELECTVAFVLKICQSLHRLCVCSQILLAMFSMP